MTLKKNILNVFLVIMMVLCLTSCKSSKLMIEEININQLEKLIENKEDFICNFRLYWISSRSRGGYTAASSGVSVFAFGGVFFCQKLRKTAPLVYGNKAV